MTDQPGFTQIQNSLLELLALLPEAEGRVMAAVARKTAGWRKECDVISYSQLEDATRMSRQGVINGIEAAIKRGILIRTATGKNNGFCYEVNYSQVVNQVDHLKQSTKLTSQRSRPEVVNEVDHQVVNEVDPQKKDSKEKKESIAASAQSAQPQPTKKRKPKAEDTTPVAVREAIAKGSGIDLATGLKDDIIQVNKAARHLWDKMRRPEQDEEAFIADIRYVGRWIRQHQYPYKDSLQRIAPHVLIKYWPAAMDARKPMNLNGNGHHPEPIERRQPRDRAAVAAEARRLAEMAARGELP